jgi:hypothetical protein
MDSGADIIIRTPTMMPNKLAQQQNEMQLYTAVFKGNPNIDQKASLRGVLEAFDRNVEEYMLDDEEKVKNAMEQAALQQSIAQQLNPQPATVGGAPGNMVQADMANNQNAITNQEAPNGQM